MSQPFVLVHIVTKLELGGAQLATLHQVQHTTFGVRPRHLLFGPGGMLDAAAAAMPGVRCWPIEALSGPLSLTRDSRAVWQLTQALRVIEKAHPGCPLLVHTHSSKAGILGRWAAWAVGAACIVHTIHGFGYQRHMSRGLFASLWAAERLTAMVTDGFTADSEANVARGRHEGLLTDKPCAVVHCGVDVAAYAPGPAPAGLKAALGIAPQDAVVLGVACLKPQKNPLSFVRVAQQVVRQRPHTSFILAGDGVLRPVVMAAIETAGIAGKCRLLGWRRDIAELLRVSDVVLHTSLWEGLPQVFAQAMACARPIVASCVDGAPEAIEVGVTGFLRSPQDAAGMAEDVCLLLADPGRAQAMGQAGLRRAQRFSQGRMLADLRAFYVASTAKPPTLRRLWA